MIDEVIAATDEDAFAAARLLGGEEGILCGKCSGDAARSALRIAEWRGRAGEFAVLLSLSADGRYSFF